jgi:hypothetical protein
MLHVVVTVPYKMDDNGATPSTQSTNYFSGASEEAANTNVPAIKMYLLAC